MELILFLLIFVPIYLLMGIISGWLQEPRKHWGEVCPECAKGHGLHDKHCNYQLIKD